VAIEIKVLQPEEVELEICSSLSEMQMLDKSILQELGEVDIVLAGDDDIGSPAGR